jgi:hypothetical protein
LRRVIYKSFKHCFLLQSDEGLFLVNLLQTNEVIAVSDGSHENGLSNSAFIITTRSQKLELITPTVMGRNCVPGAPTDQQFHRGELGGIMGIVVTLGFLCKIHHVTSGSISIEIGLDGEEAMKSVFAEWDPKPYDADYNLIILDIRCKLTKLPIKATGRRSYFPKLQLFAPLSELGVTG